MTIPSLLGSWTAKTIVGQLAKKFPKLAPYIGKATHAGFLAPSILKSLFGKNQRFYTPEAEIDERRAKTKKNIVRSGLGLVAGLGAASLAGRGASAASQMAEAAGQQGGIPPGGPGSLPPAAPTPSKMDALVGPVGTGQPTPPPTEKEQFVQGVQGIASKLPSKLEKDYPYFPVFVKKHIEAGMTPEQVYEKTKQSNLYHPLVEKHEKQTGESFLGRIEEMAGKGNIKKPAKGSEVMAPDGSIGQMIDTKKTHGLMSVNGMHHQVRLDDVEPIPEDWKTLHVDLSQVPEEEKSAPLNFLAPTPDKKQLIVKFWHEHKPLLYNYVRKDGQPIDDETLYSIANEVDAPITSGMAFSGAWNPTGKSRGGAFHQKIKILAQDAEALKTIDPKTGKPKEEEDPNKPYLFFRVPFSFENGIMTVVHEALLKSEKKWNEIYKPKKRKK